MKHWLDEVADILKSDVTDLRELAKMAGAKPEGFYIGANMDGVDVSGQDISGLKFTDLESAIIKIDDGTVFDDDFAQKVRGLSDNPEIGSAVVLESDHDLRADFGYKGPVVAAVDLGASKVTCFIMKADGVRRGDRTLTTAGVGYVQSRGVRGGSIVNLDEASEAIAQAVERAENVAGVNVQSVTVATAGGQLTSNRVAGRVSIGARPISDHDLVRAISNALAQIKLPGRRAAHILPISWSVDGQGGVRDPRAMFGRTLGVELLVVSVSEAVFQTLGACVERAHLQFEGVVAAPFVSALAALEEDEMDLGSVCIDMGGGSTSAAVFTAGSLVHVETLPVGGQHVTQDIARVLRTSIAGAERIKTLHGSAVSSAHEDHELIEVPPRGESFDGHSTTFLRSELPQIIGPRVEETFEILRDRLTSSGVPVEPGAGLVLTGGASQLAGVREVAVRVFDRPVRLGRPRRVPYLPDAASGPAFTAAAGTLHRAAFGPREAVSAKALASAKLRREPLDPRANPVAKAASWFRENL